MRRKKNLRHPAYTDGVLYYGKVETVFGAGNKRIGETFNEEGMLYYDLMSARDSDNVTANAIGYTIDKKVRVPYCPRIKTSNKVIIQGMTYDIVSLDNDRESTYLYLQRAGV